MIPRGAVLRVARPTSDLVRIEKMYTKGLGFTVIGGFDNPGGIDGVMLGHREHNYHLEFTYHHGSEAPARPDPDHLIVFYLPGIEEWKNSCARMVEAGFTVVPSANPYWDEVGRTFEDFDGFRVVLQNAEWKA